MIKTSLQSIIKAYNWTFEGAFTLLVPVENLTVWVVSGLQKRSTSVNVLAYIQATHCWTELCLRILLQGSWSCHTAEQHEGSLLVHLFLSGMYERMNESIWVLKCTSVHAYGGSLDEVSCSTYALENYMSENLWCRFWNRWDKRLSQQHQTHWPDHCVTVSSARRNPDAQKEQTWKEITIKLVSRQRDQCELHKDFNFTKYKGMFPTIYSMLRHRCPIFWKMILQYEISSGSSNRFYRKARLCVRRYITPNVPGH